MKAYVVDENVPIVANDSGRRIRVAPQANDACCLACVQVLRKIVKSGILIIDALDEVTNKYRTRLQYKGQPGVGDAFYKHVVDHQYNRKRVRRISVTRHDDREFEEFPAVEALATFDRSDRIFVALALAAPENPEVLNALDSDYSEHDEALKSVGVKVRELCPQCIRRGRGA
jgi:hypothetical protein